MYAGFYKSTAGEVFPNLAAYVRSFPYSACNSNLLLIQ